MSGYYWLMLFIIDMGKAACPYPDPNNISLVHLGHKIIWICCNFAEDV